MSGKNLSHVPDNIPGDSKDVVLNSNIISVVNMTRLAHLTTLEKISLKDNKINTFPNLNAHNDTLKIVDLSQNLISMINESLLSQLSVLEEFYISNNYLTQISIPDLQSLNKLGISYNALSELKIGVCPSLTEIHAGYNRINDIILDGNFNYNATTKIWLKQNGMTNFPSNLKQFSRLEYLYISNNYFSFIIPTELSELSQLRILEINGNSQLKDLTIANMSNLTEVHARDCGIEYIKIVDTDSLVLLSMENSNLNQMPDFDGKRTNIEIMKLQSNNLSFIPPVYFKEKGKLQELNLEKNSLTNLDGRHMMAIKILDLSYNDLDTFPMVLGGPYASLDKLFVQYNNISNITSQDAFIGNATTNNLTKLDIGGNPVLDYPAEFLGNLPNLKELLVYDMGHNDIPDVSMLPQLTHLDCHKNNISNLELKHLEKMPQMQILKLEDNAFKFLPDLRVIMEKLGHMTLKVYLSGNSLQCNPDLCWMLEQTNNR